MDKKTALAQAIVLTDQILEVLEAGEFDRVRELEAIRNPYIEQAFIESVEEIDLIRAQHLKNLNQQVVDKLNLFRQQVMQQQTRLRMATKAAHAYRSNDSVPK